MAPQKIRDVFKTFFFCETAGYRAENFDKQEYCRELKDRMKVMNRDGVGNTSSIIIPCKG